MNESMSDFREITKEEYNDYEELVDGNFTVIDARWVVSIDLRDEEPTLVVADWNNGDHESGSLFDMGHACGDYYKTLKRRYFTGCQATDAIWTTYLDLIAHRDVEAFIKSFD
ncbi:MULTISPECIES: hypothetical protein [Enterobacteriaceae]|uniref:hypothetical protein n=1 Tax=Enterobacteriaceae TaxID=543 RepID=UPI0020C021D1|nr:MULTISPECIES: hypothetical protein [Enterobacteriaceae]MCL5533678.1 hypothetical protein [Enterobacter kobei]HCR8506000.1 hypothetical protein [Shigella sonnei]